MIRYPLAVRSSSLFEDALDHPFAGVYRTKMVPNNEIEEDARFRRLTEAIKFVYASTFFSEAKAYAESIGEKITNEQMAVIVQEVVGQRFGDNCLYLDRLFLLRQTALSSLGSRPPGPRSVDPRR